MNSYLKNKHCLVLVHGLWDNPKIFCDLVKRLNQYCVEILVPDIPHEYGRIPLSMLASNLDNLILDRFGSQTTIDLLGFSMGGVISRVWLQYLGGALRTNHFLSVGSPHQGTFTAECIPSWLMPGIGDMKRSSPLLKGLNSDIYLLDGVKCSSYFCRFDMMVVPGWQAVLPIGSSQALPSVTHKGMITQPKSLEILIKDIIRDWS